MAEQTPFGDVGIATNPEPRCACVLLLDTSGSMLTVVAGSSRDLGYMFERDGKTYNAVEGGTTRLDLMNNGLKILKDELAADSLASQRCEISIITFGGRVETVTPFATAQDFRPPVLEADGDTPMGKGIRESVHAVMNRKKIYKENGLLYYRPWIFLITDGEPTDDWKAAAEMVRQGEADKAFAFFAIGVEGADMNTLAKISVRQPLALKDNNFRAMFQWLSASQKQVSRSKPGDEGGIKLDSPSGWASL
jgi:uncharacterized protein YegL